MKIFVTTSVIFNKSLHFQIISFSIIYVAHEREKVIAKHAMTFKKDGCMFIVYLAIHFVPSYRHGHL